MRGHQEESWFCVSSPLLLLLNPLENMQWFPLPGDVVSQSGRTCEAGAWGDGRERKGCGCVPCVRAGQDSSERKGGCRIERVLLSQEMGTMLKAHKDPPQTLPPLFRHLPVSSVFFQRDSCTLAILQRHRMCRQSNLCRCLLSESLLTVFTMAIHINPTDSSYVTLTNPPLLHFMTLVSAALYPETPQHMMGMVVSCR